MEIAQDIFNDFTNIFLVVGWLTPNVPINYHYSRNLCACMIKYQTMFHTIVPHIMNLCKLKLKLTVDLINTTVLLQPDYICSLHGYSFKSNLAENVIPPFLITVANIGSGVVF